MSLESIARSKITQGLVLLVFLSIRCKKIPRVLVVWGKSFTKEQPRLLVAMAHALES
jgi:hypothetical protein